MCCEHRILTLFSSLGRTRAKWEIEKNILIQWRFREAHAQSGIEHTSVSVAIHLKVEEDMQKPYIFDVYKRTKI